MKAKINSYHDLQAERLRLEGALVEQREVIRQDVAIFKEEMKPVRTVLAFAGKLVSKDKSNPLLNVGVDLVGDLLFKNFLFAKAGIITKVVAPFILKNFSSNFLSKNGDGLLDKISSSIKHLFTNKSVKRVA